MDMTDPIAKLKDRQGNLPNDKIPEAIEILEDHIAKAWSKVDPPDGIELLGVLEAHVGSANRYLAALVMDLANEVSEMWNFVGKMAGNKRRRPKKNENDLEQVMQALRFSRLMGMYGLMVAKGYSPSGLVLPPEDKRT